MWVGESGIRFKSPYLCPSLVICNGCPWNRANNFTNANPRRSREPRAVARREMVWCVCLAPPHHTPSCLTFVPSLPHHCLTCTGECRQLQQLCKSKERKGECQEMRKVIPFGASCLCQCHPYLSPDSSWQSCFT